MLPVEDSYMARIPLNDLQLEILAWVRDGTPDGVYEDYRPRITARTLHNRGLVEVSGHGQNWQATMTTDGAYYLEHGTYPADPDRVVPAAGPAEPAAKAVPRPSKAEPRQPKAPRVGPTDAMMNALNAAPDHRVEIEYDQTQRYRQLALTAERFKKIPDGMQVTVASDYRTRTAHVILEPLPEWRTRLLDPISVPAVLRDPSDIVQALQSRDDLEFRAVEKKRALRLIQALVAEARRRDYTATPVRAPVKNQWGYAERSDETTGHVKIKIGPDEYRLSIYQITEKVEHVATKGELARAGRGWALPKWDHNPTGRLGIRIDTTGISFWGQSWTDRDDRVLEDALAQVLQELELRHDAATDRRLEEERRRLERQHQWEVVREKAVQALTDSHRAELLMDQIAKWRNAAATRDYAMHLERHAATDLEGDARDEALEWVRWMRGYADRADPLRGRLRLPAPPEPTPSALQPFMGSWSPYGPS